ncbi:hypothetical protein ACP70R_040115 [Stipagrostis hirtigluma subsp. patula]
MPSGHPAFAKSGSEATGGIETRRCAFSAALMAIGKRPLAMVLYDPAAAAERQRAAKRARLATASISADAGGAMVPYSTDVQPINAVPLSAVPPRPLWAPAPPVREEPPCLRNHILPALRLRADLPVHYIAKKTVTGTDLDGHQNRFRIPTDGVLRNLRPILTIDELADANLLKDTAPRPRRHPEPEPVPEIGHAAGNVGEQEGKKKKKKMQGRAHGGLAVKLVDLDAGASWELRLSRWDSSHGTVVEGEGYLDFIRRCRFKKSDVVDIWAFKQGAFRHFGVTMCDESPLHLIIVKRDVLNGHVASG